MKSSICCADVLVPQEKLHKFELVYLLVDALSVYHPDRHGVRDGFFSLSFKVSFGQSAGQEETNVTQPSNMLKILSSCLFFCKTDSACWRKRRCDVFTWEAFRTHDLVFHTFLSAACKENISV